MPPGPTTTTDTSRRGRTILVVDDEPHVREFVRMVLAQSGYEVVAVAGATDAMAVYRADPARIDLVLSDVLMPGQTGPELALALREITPDVPVLLMSGFTGDKIHHVALPKDIEVLEKPFKLDRLLAAVSAAVSR
jgi:two-component system, cell cycle sensor histidine kinase and response regulator CckA